MWLTTKTLPQDVCVWPCVCISWFPACFSSFFIVYHSCTLSQTQVQFRVRRKYVVQMPSVVTAQSFEIAWWPDANALMTLLPDVFVPSKSQKKTWRCASNVLRGRHASQQARVSFSKQAAASLLWMTVGEELHCYAKYDRCCQFLCVCGAHVCKTTVCKRYEGLYLFTTWSLACFAFCSPHFIASLYAEISASFRWLSP